MDVSNGHLVARIEDVPESRQKRYTLIPPTLQDEAESELSGRAEARVDLRGGSGLAEWAKAKRKEQAEAFRRMQKRSRRANRRR